MKFEHDYYNPVTEWELISEEEQITNLQCKNGVYDLPSDCIIRFTRDSEYKIKATMTGVISSKDQLEPIKKIELGSFLENEIIIGVSINNFQSFECSGFAIGNRKFNLLNLNTDAIAFTAEIIIDSIIKRESIIETHTVSKIFEWFLAADSKILFPRSTHRELHLKKIKQRSGIDNTNELENEDKQIHRPASSSSFFRDYLFVDSGDLKFIVAEVPAKFGPEWSTNLCIEYRTEWGVPTSEIRTAIKEFISFIFCSHLLYIGYTACDQMSQSIECSYNNPTVVSCRQTCSSYSFSPIPIKGAANSTNIESLFANLLPIYLTLRDKLELGHVITQYFVAKESYLGSNFPILSNALEVLAEALVKLEMKNSHHYMDEQDFLKLISDDLNSISAKLNHISGKDKILNKIKGASFIGANEKLNLMFEILNFRIDKIEKKAIQTRNKMAHSSFSNPSDEEVKKYIKLTRAYQTLLHRVILKVLGYNGNYIDYYSSGHKIKNIDIPISE